MPPPYAERTSTPNPPSSPSHVEHGAATATVPSADTSASQCSQPGGTTCCRAFHTYFDEERAAGSCLTRRRVAMLVAGLVILVIALAVTLPLVLRQEGTSAQAQCAVTTTNYATAYSEATCGSRDFGATGCYLDCGCEGGLPSSILQSYVAAVSPLSPTLLNLRCTAGGDAAPSGKASTWDLQPRPAGITVLNARATFTFSGALVYKVTTSAATLLAGSLPPGESFEGLVMTGAGAGPVEFQLSHDGTQTPWFQRGDNVPASDLAALEQAAAASLYTVRAGWASCEVNVEPACSRLFSGRAMLGSSNAIEVRWLAPTTNKAMLGYMRTLLLVSSAPATRLDDTDVTVAANRSAALPSHARVQLRRQCYPYYITAVVVGSDFSQGPEGLFCHASPSAAVYMRDAPLPPNVESVDVSDKSVLVRWRGTLDTGGCDVSYSISLYRGERASIVMRITGESGEGSRLSVALALVAHFVKGQKAHPALLSGT